MMTTASPPPGQGWYAATPFRAEPEPIAPGVCLIRLSGDLDIDTSDIASEAVRANVAPPARIVVLDLSGVTFCSSSGLRVLVAAAREAAAHGIELRLAGAGRPVRRPMQVTSLDIQFLSFSSVAAALAHGTTSAGREAD
ncbi:MAG TPA: STAS domain-containing protein [Kribbellaceae bacterium]|nr:STAS domain-containing protein [Kribbellaceae bacterium]